MVLVVLNRLLPLGIIVDPALVSHLDGNEPWSALCDLTSCIAFNSPATLQERLPMLEEEDFLNMKLRKRARATKPPVAAADFEAKRMEWSTARKYVSPVKNHGLKAATLLTPLETPEYAIWFAQQRTARIWSEIRHRANHSKRRRCDLDRSFVVRREFRTVLPSSVAM
jgi:hypothetical protein